jgi:hypothetical protein
MTGTRCLDIPPLLRFLGCSHSFPHRRDLLSPTWVLRCLVRTVGIRATATSVRNGTRALRETRAEDLSQVQMVRVNEKT